MAKRIAPRDPNAVEVTVQGIPALALIEHYRPGEPAKIHGPPETCHPGADEECDWTLWDKRGYAAPWLEKLADERDVEEQVLDAIHQRQREAACPEI